MKKGMSKKVASLVVIGTLLSSNIVYADALIQKDESVYVTLTEDGAVKEQIVSDWLHIDNPEGKIEDKSSLQDIKNIKGNEKPDKNGENLVWNTDKKDIFYQGKTDKNLPLEMSIKYELDGQSVNPKDIVGKSGKLKLKIKYKNTSYKTVNIKGENRKIYTPFTTVTVVNLPIDKFNNVKINSGEMVSDGNNQVVTFIALPGLKESLNINKDVDEALDLKDELEITADVENFEMGPIMVTATPKIPEVKEFKEAKNFDELFDGLDKLKDASSKLEDGSLKLKDGSLKLRDGLNLAKEKVDGVQGKMNNEQDKLALIKSQANVEQERKLINHAYFAKDLDTSLLDLGMVFANSDVQKLIEKSLNDYKALNIKSIMQLPAVKKLMAEQNINNMNKLMNDADKLSKIDRNKLKPLMGVLQHSDSLVALANDASKFYNGIDISKIDPLIKLAQNKDAILKLASDANDLGKVFKSEQLKSIMGLAQNKEKVAGLLKSTDELSKIDLQNMKKFLQAQNLGAQQFIQATAFLENQEKVKNLQGNIQASESLTKEEKQELMVLIQASTSMRQGMIASSAKMNGLSSKLNELEVLQQNLKEISPALKALPNSMDYVASTIMPKANGLFNQMEKMAPALQKVQGSMQYIDSLMPQITKLQGEFQKNKPVIEGAQKALNPETMAYIKEITPMLASMQKDLDANEENIKNIKILMKSVNGNGDLKNKLNALEKDLNKARPIVNKFEKSLTKEQMAQIKNSPKLIGKLKSMQQDLKDSEKILQVIKSSLEQNNVEQARKLINALPSLSEGVGKLANGSNELYNGLDTLSSGMKKFNDEGINKLYSELKDKTSDVEKLIDIKDNIVKLSNDYGTFTGVTNNMDAKVKFVMKTDEIKIPEKKQEVKQIETEDKGGFINWIKKIFHIK